MTSTLRLAALSAGLALTACCVAATTPVRTPRGEVPLGTLVVGDVVCSVDVSTGRVLAATIVQVRRATRECLALRWQGGALVCTPDHPLYCPETATYRPASDWVTGTARSLLIAGEGSVQVVTVAAHETFAGVHEVVDITLDTEPHNFIAAGVVVHNKSPAPLYDSEVAPGPVLELGPGDVETFRVRVCLDSDDTSSAETAMTVTTATGAAPTDGVPAEVTIDIEPLGGDFTGEVPFEEVITDYGVTCSDGYVVAFSRSDAGTTGTATVTWSVEATIDRIDTGTGKLGVYITAEP